ncbi:putative hydrolase [Streptomyces sp. NBRC 110611]|uniref:alpha/beta fold hydrolase n=1 Tax=Streptomyces sp. NBRC 110611 TaxID=1621259 RepID=UPI000835FDC4|nr:alpha/beta hydrolase [Streptomyces sp. NBRC 110611]GAU66972.1 putative hydrolase [Streptomyces sp. NBRC 110611]
MTYTTVHVPISGGDSAVKCLVTGAGPALVLVHGTGATPEGNWGPVIHALKDRYTIVAPTLSGSGATTDTGAPLSVADLVNQVLGTADAAGLGTFHLAGHSLGATVAAAVAGAQPQRVDSLFLHAGWAVSDAWQVFQFDLWQRLLRTDKDLLSRMLQLTAMGPKVLEGRTAADFERGVAGFNELFDAEGMARQSDLNTRVDIAEELARITAPTLVVAGSHDLIAPPHHQRRLAAAIAAAEYVELDGGHALPFEQPEVFAGALTEFLARHSAGAGHDRRAAMY